MRISSAPSHPIERCIERFVTSYQQVVFVLFRPQIFLLRVCVYLSITEWMEVFVLWKLPLFSAHAQAISTHMRISILRTQTTEMDSRDSTGHPVQTNTHC